MAEATAPATTTARSPCRARADRGDEPHDKDHEDRPHDVELLLDGQGPRVQQRSDLAGLNEIALAAHDEPPVRPVEKVGNAVPTQSWVGAGGRRESGVEHSEEEHHEQRRQQPPSPPGPEGPEGDMTGPGPLCDEECGDQEPRKHEEGVDPEEPRRKERHPAVIRHDTDSTATARTPSRAGI